MGKEIIREINKALWGFYRKRKDRFLLFCFFGVILLFLRVNPLFPYYLTDRKIFYILCLLVVIFFQINSRGVAKAGLFLLVMVAIGAFFGKFGLVQKMVVYAWGFLILACFVRLFEYFWQKR